MTLSAHERALKVGMRASRHIAGASVTYTRASTSITISKAIQGELRYGTIGNAGAEVVVELVDWLIDATALTLGDPAIGDTIARVIDGTTHTYTVENMDMGLSHWDWSDTGRTQYRIRTRADGATAYTVVKPNGFDLSGTEIRYE